MKGVRDFYDKTARDWADKWYADEGMLPCLEAFMKRLPPAPRVLDLGCGAGYETMRLNRLGAAVDGLDFSRNSISIAQERNPHIPFHARDLLEDYSDLGAFDGIAAVASLIHISDDRLEIAFRRMADALKSGGLALVVVRDGTGKQDKQSYVTLDGEEYDRDFHAHTLNALIGHSSEWFEYQEELLPDEAEIWKNYLFARR